jgi:hypothetical protein
VAAIAGVIVMIKGNGDLSTANGETTNAAHLSASKMTQDHSNASTELGVGGAILGAGVVAAGEGAGDDTRTGAVGGGVGGEVEARGARAVGTELDV